MPITLPLSTIEERLIPCILTKIRELQIDFSFYMCDWGVLLDCL